MYNETNKGAIFRPFFLNFKFFYLLVLQQVLSAFDVEIL